MSKDPAVLHLYPGASYHDEGYVVGNRAGLLNLRDAIDRALEKQHSETTVFVSDGEGYEVFVIMQDTSWQDKIWQNLLLPYAKDSNPNVLYPHQLIKGDSSE